MHPYIPHLLADIKEAHRRMESHDEDPTGGRSGGDSTIEEHLEDVERWIAGDPEHSFGYYCGLQRVNFPPAEQLSDGDLITVCNAFRELLFSWNADIDLPEALPLPLKYHFVVGTLDEGFTVVNSGRITFDYCSGDAPDCPFKEYCPCLEIWNKEDDPGEETDRKGS